MTYYFQMRLLERQSSPLTQMDKLLIDDLLILGTSVYTEVFLCFFLKNRTYLILVTVERIRKYFCAMLAA